MIPLIRWTLPLQLLGKKKIRHVYDPFNWMNFTFAIYMYLAYLKRIIMQPKRKKKSPKK